MACLRPLQAWRQPAGELGGKSTIVFGRDHLDNWDIASPLDLPCGQCVNCRLEKSRRWAVRIMHESQMHEASCFLTLTYSDENLPSGGSLRKSDFQDFMKRLRRRSGVPLRYFHCGEYGDATDRAHYHCCLFGDDFADDRVLFSRTSLGDSLYSSRRLCEVWGLGHAMIGALTFESAAYVARYCLKKVYGKAAEEHYGGREPEYVTMSRRPGIGSTWFSRFKGEVYPSDSVVMRGKEMMPPPYYDNLLEKLDKSLFDAVKYERQKNAPEVPETRRLHDMNICREKLISHTLKRSL